MLKGTSVLAPRCTTCGSMVILFSGMNVQLMQAEEEFRVVTLVPALAPVAGDI